MMHFNKESEKRDRHIHPNRRGSKGGSKKEKEDK